MDIDIMGVAETFWEGSGEFMSTLPNDDEQYKVIFSGGEHKRKGVAVILNEKTSKAIMTYETLTERQMYVRISAKPFNLFILQVYAPCNDADDEDKERFYEEINNTVQNKVKHDDCLIILGDFNAKVGNGRESDIVGQYGLGERNENGQHLIEFAEENNMFICNTWFQQRSAAHRLIRELRIR